mmetsp:Transcript_110184/g.152436  ORF Transcript_110184/g.152436 Transcript_110184/m.152436 type:complete len:226 (-) Transcript_110184:52-729(-)
MNRLAGRPLIRDERRELEQFWISAEPVDEYGLKLSNALPERCFNRPIERQVQVVSARTRKHPTESLLGSRILRSLLLGLLQPLFNIGPQLRCQRLAKKAINKDDALLVESSRGGSIIFRQARCPNAKLRKQWRLLHQGALLVGNLLHSACLERSLSDSTIKEEKGGSCRRQSNKQQVPRDDVVDAGAGESVEEDDAEGRDSGEHAQRLQRLTRPLILLHPRGAAA